jgi:hypothetical protein
MQRGPDLPEAVVADGEAGQADAEADRVQHEERRVLLAHVIVRTVAPRPEAVTGEGDGGCDHRRDRLGQQRLQAGLQQDVEDGQIDEEGEPADEAELADLTHQHDRTVAPRPAARLFSRGRGHGPEGTGDRHPLLFS